MAQCSIEEQVKTLHKHMGLILVTVRDLKASLDALKNKDAAKGVISNTAQCVF